MYNIKLEQYEGPLDLLLDLIEKEKLDVTRLSLSRVADQYLDYISDKRNISLENLSEFLSVASRLILIKSKALLPLLEFTEEEEEEIKDLENQLLEYKKFKDAAKKIEEIVQSGKGSFTREGFHGTQTVFCPPESLGVEDLKKIFDKVLGSIPEKQQLEEEIVKEVISLEDKITHLQDVIKNRIAKSFSEIISQSNDKIDVIVSFLALLELVKQRVVQVEQESHNHDITFKHNE